MAAYTSWLDSVDTSLDLNLNPLRFSGDAPVGGSSSLFSHKEKNYLDLERKVSVKEEVGV